MLSEVLPAYGNYGNPLDVTAGFSPDSLPVAVKALIDDPNVGMLFISFPISYRRGRCKAFNKGMADSPQAQGHGGARRHLAARRPMSCRRSSESPAVFSRSSDRMLRAIALYTRYGRFARPHPRAAADPAPFPGMPKLGKGTQPEWLGKKVLAAAGIRVPEGELARTAGEAAAVARRVGYPVALKAQAAALSHKTEAGGVMLNLADEAALRAAWATMQQNVERAAPGVTLDGGLVEKMSPKGLELMIGRQARSGLGHGAAARARRHLGRGAGRRAAAAGRRRRDAVRRGAAQAAHAPSCSPASAARRRRTSRRWRRPCSRIGRLMRTTPGIVEIDVNPLMVHARGQGVTALDALIVAE